MSSLYELFEKQEQHWLEILQKHVENGHSNQRQAMDLMNSIFTIIVTDATFYLTKDFARDRLIVDQVALQYIQRIVSSDPFLETATSSKVTKQEFYGLFVVCAVLAAKYLCDVIFSIKHWTDQFDDHVNWSNNAPYGKLERVVLKYYLNWTLTATTTVQ